MAVAVVPGLLVAVSPARRQQLIEHLRQVLLEAGLELDGADRRRAADGEDVADAGLHPRAGDDAAHVLGEVVPVAVARRPEGDLLLNDHGRLSQGYVEGELLPRLI